MIKAILTGPTAAGKTGLAFELAKRNCFDVLSVDSRQIYRGMGIGSAHPGPELLAQVPHHFIGCCDPGDKMSAPAFRDIAHGFLVSRSSKDFLVVGGSGLYLKALIANGAPFELPVPQSIREQIGEEMEQLGPRAWERLRELDPHRATRIHPNDRYRIAKALENHHAGQGRPHAEKHLDSQRHSLFQDAPLWILKLEPQVLRDRIERRVQEMLETGWIEETQSLLSTPGIQETTAWKALGYSEVGLFLEGRLGREELSASIVSRTWRYAKKQQRYLRSQFPDALEIHLDAALEAADKASYEWNAFVEEMKKNSGPFP